MESLIVVFLASKRSFVGSIPSTQSISRAVAMLHLSAREKTIFSHIVLSDEESGSPERAE